MNTTNRQFDKENRSKLNQRSLRKTWKLFLPASSTYTQSFLYDKDHQMTDTQCDVFVKSLMCVRVCHRMFLFCCWYRTVHFQSYFNCAVWAFCALFITYSPVTFVKRSTRLSLKLKKKILLFWKLLSTIWRELSACCFLDLTDSIISNFNL